MKIEEHLTKRADLSTFLVHFTKDLDKSPAREQLESIIKNNIIIALSPLGLATSQLKNYSDQLKRQECVCFTETPLEYISLLSDTIEGRKCDLKPYGIAITKKQGRKGGINPVWYLDITPGHEFLVNSVNKLVQTAIDSKDLENPIFQITPYMQVFGKNVGGGSTYNNDFYWEREWRIVEAFQLPSHYLIIAPEEDHPHFYDLLKTIKGDGNRFYCISANWNLETIIARLACFHCEDIGL